jgi:hypothetical protein
VPASLGPKRAPLPADGRRLHVVEHAQDQRVGEEEGVVEERLADEERKADDGSPRVGAEDRLGDRDEADALLLADLDRLLRLLELRDAGGLLDLALDAVDQLLGVVGVAGEASRLPVTG